MNKFETFRGIVAVLDRANIDTDAIIPKQFLKSIARTGFGESLFYDWRYLDNGEANPDFSLNQERYRGASILVARNNFGCGSSREHAVWAIEQYGFRAVIAPRVKKGSDVIPAFADIFRNNCGKNGILCVELEESEVEEIFQMVERTQGLEVTVDIDEERVVLHLDEEMAFHFDIDPALKEKLIHGLDDIGITLKELEKIEDFEKKHNPQIYGVS